MAWVQETIGPLRLCRPNELTQPNDAGIFSDGAPIACQLREIEHPEGRFRRADGKRYDVCVMEMSFDPGLRAPSISRENFLGDGADSQPTVIRLGNVRQTSFRLHLISPGTAFGTLSAAGKPAAAFTT